MKTKTYEIEVVHTARVRVTLPETMNSDEFIRDWESGLWPLEDNIDNVAEYAARMAVECPSGNHDGIGRLITSGWQKPDYIENPYQVVAIVDDDETEVEIISCKAWT